MKYHSFNFKSIYVFDFEFHKNGNEGNPSAPITLCAYELLSKEKINLWLEQGTSVPYPTGADSLFICYHASAEISCHIALNWPIPENVIDLESEFRCLQNGKYVWGVDPKNRWNLLAALTFYGLSGMSVDKKNSMRDRIIEGPPYSTTEKMRIQEYCEEDVIATEMLFRKMLPYLDIPYALMRGRFSANCGQIESVGIPIDMDIFNSLKGQWGSIQLNLIKEVDKEFRVYEKGTFKEQNFIKYLMKNNINWPHTPTGKPQLSQDTFKQMSTVYPQMLPLKELRATIGKMRLKKLQVGDDGRNRCMLSQFGTVTSRCSPSTSKYVFGPATWIRYLIKPSRGMAVCYADYDQQEYAVAAVLSGDTRMQQNYKSGDPYLEFAKLARAVPSNATKQSHPTERELYKQCTLAIGYGMGFKSFALRINRPESYARKLLRQHKKLYPDFWNWSDKTVRFANSCGLLKTVFGWQYQWPFKKRPGEEANPRQIRNWPIQSCSADMLRYAVYEILKNNIRIVALVHDAVMIEAPITKIEESVEICKEAMVHASRIILNGFEVSVDTKTVKYPDRYTDERGWKMWNIVQDILNPKNANFDRQVFET